MIVRITYDINCNRLDQLFEEHITALLTPTQLGGFLVFDDAYIKLTLEGIQLDIAEFIIELHRKLPKELTISGINVAQKKSYPMIPMIYI